MNPLPLASRMRPRSLAEVVGQEHLIGEHKPLTAAVKAGHLHSMILWGPPGVGKTTLAHLLAREVGAEFQSISAVLSGVKEIRECVATAEALQAEGKRLVLFVDEVHRFNKSQQDAFLPHLENGLITLIGATTENPSFALNHALLSRARVYLLKPLELSHLLQILQRAREDGERGLSQPLSISPEVLADLARAADGDARQALNLLELAADFAVNNTVTAEIVEELFATALRRFDREGDIFYEQISALHKSVRGSDPDAALYWMARMLDGGCDPHYIARRVVRMASEDIGNADPRALHLALDAWQVFERLGSPEGELALAQAIVYCAVAAKSNAVYAALNAVRQDAKLHGSLEVPLYLRNAPTSLLKRFGHGEGYRYPHDEPDGFACGVDYLPLSLQGRQYYHPVERGLEIKIKERVDRLRTLNHQHKGSSHVGSKTPTK